MSDPIKPSAQAADPEPAVPEAPPKPAPDAPASLADARLGPTSDPAEGKRE